MIKKDTVFQLLQSFKGWPAREAETLEEASRMILGSPYWQIPEDTYIIIDQNETYSLIAVYRDGRSSWDNRYLAVNMKLLEKIKLL